MPATRQAESGIAGNKQAQKRSDEDADEMVHHVCRYRTMQNVFRNRIGLAIPPVQAGERVYYTHYPKRNSSSHDNTPLSQQPYRRGNHYQRAQPRDLSWKKLVGGGYMTLVNNAVPCALARLGYSPHYKRPR
jgi:hypothetical protein